MKVIVEGQTKEVNLRDFKKALKKFEGEDISSWWNWYIGCYDFRVRYKLLKVGRRITITCYQAGRSWDIEVPTKDFIQEINYYAPEDIRRALGQI